MKNGKKIMIALLITLIIILVALIILLFSKGIIIFNSNTHNTVSNENTEEISKEEESNKNNIKNNLTIMLSNECSEGCTKSVASQNNEQSNLYVSSSEIKLDETSILKFEDDAYHLSQVTVYNDIIITLQGFSLGLSMVIYDFDGNKIKTITIFNDNDGRLFNVYPGYSDTESFHVSNDGVIHIVGTKHLQGSANTYIDNNGSTIDLCTQGDGISKDEIVSGIFKFNYLNDYSFSDIEYVDTKTTIKDIKSCVTIHSSK